MFEARFSSNFGSGGGGGGGGGTGVTGTLVLWLKADAITGYSDGAPLDTWIDSTDNNRDVKSTGSSQPTYQTNELNSKPIVRFDGSNDYMTIGNGLKVPIGSFSIFIVFKTTSGGTLYEFVRSAGVSTPALQVKLWPDIKDAGAVPAEPPSINYRNGPAAQNNSYLSSKDAADNWGKGGTWRIVTHSCNGTHSGHKLYINGTLQTLTDRDTEEPGSYEQMCDLYLGAPDGAANLFFNGDIAELMVYSPVLSNEERIVAEAYLNAKYAVY